MVMTMMITNNEWLLVYIIVVVHHHHLSCCVCAWSKSVNSVRFVHISFHLGCDHSFYSHHRRNALIGFFLFWIRFCFLL